MTFTGEQGPGVGRDVCQWVDLPKSVKMAVLGAILGTREANELSF